MDTQEERLRTLIKALKLSQAAFAKKIGVKGSTITDFYAGRSKGLSRDTLINMSNIFGVSLNWFLLGEGSMFLGEKRKKASSNHLENVSSPPAEKVLVQEQTPFCQTTVECLQSINSENMHHTQWYKELSDDRQFLVCAANTPDIQDTVIAQIVGFLNGVRFSQENPLEMRDARLYKKGEAG